jgi:hypothetical protein
MLYITAHKRCFIAGEMKLCGNNKPCYWEVFMYVATNDVLKTLEILDTLSAVVHW